jgi:hypothetical protein
MLLVLHATPTLPQPSLRCDMQTRRARSDGNRLVGINYDICVTLEDKAYVALERPALAHGVNFLVCARLHVHA